MFASLRFRLWLTYVLVVGVVLAIAWLVIGIYVLRNPVQDRREVQRLRVVSSLIVQRSQLFDLQSSVSSSRLEGAVRRIDQLLSARIAIYNSAGVLLADSRRGSAAPLPEWSYFAGRRLGVAPVFRDAANRQWLYVVTPMEGDLALLAAVPRPRLVVLQVLRDDFLTPFLRGGLLALGLTVLFAVWIANWIASPLQRLERATRQVPSESFQNLPLDGPREVWALARSFNEMAASVRSSQLAQHDLVANISHDLKTPLTSIQGYAQAILDGTAKDKNAARQAAQVIYDEAGRMNRMVARLLELARIQAGALSFERKPVHIDLLLRRLVEKFLPQARQAQVDLRLDFASPQEDMPVILADEDRLAQVFSNLIDNALKYTPSGGQASVAARLAEGWVEVEVADTGPGIPPAELERIFERFYQTDKARRGGGQRGVGLGLAIAREIVQAHGGTIDAHNRSQMNPSTPVSPGPQEPASGSVFVVRLPLARPGDETLAHVRKEVNLRSPAHS